MTWKRQTWPKAVSRSMYSAADVVVVAHDNEFDLRLDERHACLHS